MNMFKSNGGFTLVELIVVIAILAILAGVAVPAYSGYISKANEAADYTMLDTVKTAAFFLTMEKEPEAVVTRIDVSESAVTVTTETKTYSDLAMSEFIDEIKFKSNTASAFWLKDAGTTEYKSGWNLVAKTK